jgi:hypothetical protein
VPPDAVPIEVDAVTVVNAPAAGVTLPIMPWNDVPVATPRVGVTRVGLVANTKAPEPVSPVTAAAKFADDGVPRNVATPVPRLEMPVPPFVTLSNGPASNNESMVSKLVFTLVPQVSVDAPTSGFVSNRFVVVVSAIFYPYAAICHDSLLSAIAVQVSLLSEIAVHVSDVSVIGVQVSELSEIAFHVSAVSDSATHFRLPAIVIDDWQVKLMAKLCRLVALILTLDVAAISTDPRKTTLAATVITPKS